MNYTDIYKKIIVLWLVIGVGGILSANNAGAFSGVTIDPARSKAVKINALIMEVNIEKSYLIVAEKRFDVTEYKMDGEIHKTALLNANGQAVPLQSFKEGQRVLVKGIKLPKGEMIAEVVQEIAPSKAGR